MMYSISVVELVVGLVTLGILAWLYHTKKELEAKLRVSNIQNDLKENQIDKLEDDNSSLRDELVEEKQEMARALEIIKKITNE